MHPWILFLAQCHTHVRGRTRTLTHYTRQWPPALDKGMSSGLGQQRIVAQETVLNNNSDVTHKIVR